VINCLENLPSILCMGLNVTSSQQGLAAKIHNIGLTTSYNFYTNSYHSHRHLSTKHRTSKS
jgi:hypothetical protein